MGYCLYIIARKSGRSSLSLKTVLASPCAPSGMERPAQVRQVKRRTDGNDVETQFGSRLPLRRQVIFCRAHDPRRLPLLDRFQRGIHRPPRLDLDEYNRLTLPRHQVDFTHRGFVTPRQNPIPFQPQKPRSKIFSAESGAVTGHGFLLSVRRGPVLQENSAGTFQAPPHPVRQACLSAEAWPDPCHSRHGGQRW